MCCFKAIKHFSGSLGFKVEATFLFFSVMFWAKRLKWFSSKSRLIQG
jgi:hypothetical protein